MAARRRTYELYADFRGRFGSFTTRSDSYDAGSHRWVYEVRATSIRQAYALAARETWAADSRAVGVLRVECDWWHYRSSPGPGDSLEAAYLLADRLIRDGHATEERRP